MILSFRFFGSPLFSSFFPYQAVVCVPHRELFDSTTSRAPTYGDSSTEATAWIELQLNRVIFQSGQGDPAGARAPMIFYLYVKTQFELAMCLK